MKITNGILRISKKKKKTKKNQLQEMKQFSYNW